MKDFFPNLHVYLLRLFAEIAVPKWFLATAVAAGNYIFPDPRNGSSALAAIVLVLFDTFTGLVASRICGEAVTSAKLSRFFVKIFGYAIVLCTVSITFKEVEFFQALRLPAISAVVTAVILTEAVSILENSRRMGLKPPGWIDKMLQDRLSRNDSECQK